MVRRNWKAYVGVIVFLALYAVVCTIEARDSDARQPFRVVAQ